MTFREREFEPDPEGRYVCGPWVKRCDLNLPSEKPSLATSLSEWLTSGWSDKSGIQQAEPPFDVVSLANGGVMLTWRRTPPPPPQDGQTAKGSDVESMDAASDGDA